MTLTQDECIAGGASPVLKLQRRLYDLKQAGCLWNNLLHAQLTGSGYTRCITDLCLYYKHKGNDIAIVGIYGDDLLATATNPQMVEDLFSNLQALEVKDLGVVRKFLGIRVQFKPDGYVLDQETLVREYIEAHALTTANPLTTPLALHEDLACDELIDEIQTKQFRTLAGGLLWIARCTRPDIAFALHQMTRRTHAPRLADMRLGPRVLRYLLATVNWKLYAKNNAQGTLALSAFTDADFAAQSDRKSISASTVHLNGLLIHWCCTKQSSVSLSTI
jgi:hypothetical protein